MGFMKKAMLLGGIPVRPSTKRERSRKANIRAARALERQTQLMEQQAQRQPVPTAPPPQGPPAGWYADPHGQAPQRWWDGARWTEHVQ